MNEALVREYGTSESLHDHSGSRQWADWAMAEERRRTIFAAYVLSNLQNITFDTPPLILNNELDLLLPDYTQPVSHS
jgi:hypothetical protein